VPEDVLLYNAEVMHYVLGQVGVNAHENTDNVHLIHGMARNFDDDTPASRKTQAILNLKPRDLLDHSKCRRLVDEVGNGQRKTVAQHILACILLFMQISTGPYWLQLVAHACAGLACAVCGGAPQEAVKQAARCVKTLLLRVLTCVPQTNKWTKLGPCLRFVASGILLQRMLPALFMEAFKAFKSIVASDEFANVDPAMAEEVDFHAVNSQRVQKTLTLLCDDESCTKLIIVAIIMEPLQWLTSVLLANSKEILDTARAPLLLDALSMTHSPFVVVMQYFASLLHGCGGRV